VAFYVVLYLPLQSLVLFSARIHTCQEIANSPGELRNVVVGSFYVRSDLLDITHTSTPNKAVGEENEQDYVDRCVYVGLNSSNVTGKGSQEAIVDKYWGVRRLR